jgi:hypothetical protein
MADWTLLVYIVADHTGVPRDQIPAKIDEIAHLEVDNILWAADLQKVNVGIQVDFTFDPGILRVIADGKGREDTVLPDSGSGRIETFQKFIHEVAVRCPAEHYMLLLWGHGLGPIGFFSDANGSDVLASGDKTLSLVELEDVLRYAASAEGFDQKVDLLLAKSCTVATVETAWQIRDHVNLLIGSQATVPLKEWTYGQLFKALDSSDQVKPPTLEHTARRVLDALNRQFQFAAARDGQTEVPYSLIDPSRVWNLQSPMQALGAAMAVAGPQSSAIRAAVANARRMPITDPAFLDLLALSESLQKVPAVTGPATQMLNVLQDAGVSPVLARRPDPSAFNGIGVFYFPEPDLRSKSLANFVTTFDYHKLESSAATAWNMVAFAEDRVGV